MKKISLNHDWVFARGTITMMEMFMGSEEKLQKVDIPHDAMVSRDRTESTANQHQTGFYPGGEYTYVKQWNVPADWEGQSVVLEFEGIADTCRIYINGDFVGEHNNPYTGILIDAARYLKYGQENELKVEVRSVEQSSRWYSGAGLYRPVSAWVGGTVHIPVQGTRVTTLEADSAAATVEVRVPIRNLGIKPCRTQITVSLALENENGDSESITTETATVTVFGESTQWQYLHMCVEQPRLWSDEIPSLYHCLVEIREGDCLLDSICIPVGIRTLRLNAVQGLLLNGKETKLRGTCIHHDNGVIGAATFPDAEYRRCRQMKEAGFNAIRSAHHPMSKAMLEACDRLGMLVMDELSDMWTRTKNPHDYANYFPAHWEDDVRDMVEKDYNHPCVIMYSTGNEIPEAGTPRGAEWNRKINDDIKKLDNTRYTTSGINGLMAGADRMGEIMCQAMGISPEELEAMMQPGDGNPQAGADAVNDMASVMVGPLADAIATSPVLEELIDEFAAVTDVAGYNYLTALHEEEHKRHPGRVVLGTETFPADIVNLWAIVKRNPHVLGDFTWTGYDYIGEAGCGIFHYDGGENFSAHWPDRLGGIGDIDILGERKPISFLRQAVYGLGNVPAIGVLRMDRAGKNSAKTPWMWKDNLSSWTWPGYEGRIASIDVYANADEVELKLNGKSMGRRIVAGTYAATFEIPYEPGTLEAVSYLRGKEAGRSVLRTAGEAKRLLVEADREALPADGESLAFLTIRLTDGEGNWNRWHRERITVTVEGNAILQGFGSANPSCEGSYQGDTWETFDGSVMAVIRAGRETGKARIKIFSENLGNSVLELAID